jgi:hypothetical protein
MIMRSSSICLLTAAVFVVSLAVPMLAGGETRTVTGELIEMNCYARMGGNAVGADHAECALRCAQGGAPLGILTADEEIISIIGEMTNDENAQLLEFVGKNVRATGEFTEDGGGPGTTVVGKDGMIDVTSIELQ